MTHTMTSCFFKNEYNLRKKSIKNKNKLTLFSVIAAKPVEIVFEKIIDKIK